MYQINKKKMTKNDIILMSTFITFSLARKTSLTYFPDNDTIAQQKSHDISNQTMNEMANF